MKNGIILLVIIFIMNFNLISSPANIHDSSNEKSSIGTLTKVSTSIDFISITSNAEFLNYASSGNGSIYNPFIIENYEIYGSSQQNGPISIQNTNRYFVLQNINIQCIANNFAGIYFSSVLYGTIANVSVSSCVNGIRMINSNRNNITNSFLKNNQFGVDIDNSRNLDFMSNNANFNDYGFNIQGSTTVYFYNNTASFNSQAIFLLSSSQVTAEANIISNNKGTGLYYSSSTNVTITKNSFINNNNIGIQISNSPSSTITNNIFQNNSLQLSGDTSPQLQQQMIANNTIDGKELLFLQNENYQTVSTNNVGQIILVNCSSSTIQNQQFVNISFPIQMLLSSNISILNNTFTGSRYNSIYSRNINSSTFKNNTFMVGLDYDIFVYNGQNNTLINNKFLDNDFSINFYSSTNNIIYNNTLQGFYLYYSPNNTINKNNFINKSIILTAGPQLSDYMQTQVSNNTLNAQPLLFLQNQFNLTINQSLGGLIALNSSNLTITNQINVTVQILFCLQSIIVNNSLTSLISNALTISHSSNITIERNSFFNSNIGLSLYNTNMTKILTNTISNCSQGLSIRYNSHANYLFNNTVKDNSLYGVTLSDSPSNTVENNLFINNIASGLNIDKSLNNNIIGNNFVNNGITFTIISNQHEITNNTVNGKPLVYLDSQSNVILSNNIGQVILTDCSNITIENQDLSNSSVGLYLSNSNNIQLQNITSSNNLEGLILQGSTGVNLDGINASNNFALGLLITTAKFLSISNSTFNNNFYSGFLVSSCSNCQFINNIINNNSVAGFYSFSITLSTFTNNTIDRNSIYGFISSYATNNSFYKNFITENNNIGLIIENSYSNLFLNNSVSNNNQIGLQLLNSQQQIGLSGNTLEYNSIQNNSIGLKIDLSDNTLLRYNNFNSNRDYGLVLNETKGTIVTFNNFINNNGTLSQAYATNDKNNWSIANYGNYWSDYTGVDQNNDSIGDIPYHIAGPGLAVDSNPLMVRAELMPSVTTSVNTESSTQLISTTDSLNGTGTGFGDLTSLLTYGALLGGIGMGAVLLVEIRRVRLPEQNFKPNKFEKWLRKKIGNKQTKKAPLHLSDETLNKIEEIIDENLENKV